MREGFVLEHQPRTERALVNELWAYRKLNAQLEYQNDHYRAAFEYLLEQDWFRDNHRHLIKHMEQWEKDNKPTAT